jgi:hypothetical protein
MKMPKLLAGVSIMAAALGGMYAIAATTAASMAGGFATEESSSHTRNVAFSTEVQRVSTEHKAARAKCELASGKERKVCNARARVEEIRAFRGANPF